MRGYDVAVIGGGPGGYTAAIRAAQLGKTAVLIERDELGGVCLNRGCIPTKTFEASASVLRQCKRANEFGIIVEGAAGVDFAKVQERKGRILDTLRKGIEQLLIGNGVEVVKGEAKLIAPHNIAVGDETIRAENIVVATGSSWIEIPGLKVDGVRIQNSDHAMEWKELPKSIAIVGGGYIGCEFASFMNTMGVDVTIVEAMDRLITIADRTVSKALEKKFKENGIETLTDSPVESAKVEEDHVEIVLKDGDSVRADLVLVSVGRRPDAANLGLENVGVGIGRKGEITVNDRFESSVKGVCAVGDVNGISMLAHAASEQAISCIDSMYGGKPHYDNSCVPACVFSNPEIGSVGRTGEELKAAGVAFKTGRFAFASLGKAHVDGCTDGQIIIYAGEDDRILGVHIIGENATGLIAEAAVAVKRGLTTRELSDVIHAHPTLSEVLAEAARDVNGRAIHKVGRKRNAQR
jgi:dihydrolipoamide dehydrogenase